MDRKNTADMLHASVLDCLAQQTGVPYLSDLLWLEHWELRRAVKSIPESYFPAKSWLDALSYLTGAAIPPRPANAKTAKQLLLDSLKPEP